MNCSLPVTIKGIVTHGNKIGTGLNMPTANLTLDDSYKNFPHGVYYSEVKIGSDTYKGISNLGIKPTVKNDTSLNLETFIYDFDGDLYEKEISVTLLKFRRPEKKFESINELETQMHRDMEAGRSFTASLRHV